MYKVIVLYVLSILHLQQVIPVESACKKTLNPALVNDVDQVLRSATMQLQSSSSSSNTSLPGFLATLNTPVEHAPATTLPNVSYKDEELESLRLEYYKYKIISQLGVTTNPDEWQPKIPDRLRSSLLSSLPGKEQDHITINKPTRHKRSLSCSQVKSSKDACCLESFYVNFTDIGWDKWILHPSGYNANYCRGQCDLSHARYYHSTLLSKFNNVIGLCCSPKKMQPLQLLYIDDDSKVHQKMMPDMIVESCDCA